jgi:hypothetical protein
VSGGTISAPVLAYDEGGQSICSVANSCKSFGIAVDPVNQIAYSADYSTASPWTYRQLKAYSFASSITNPTLLQNLTLPANTKPLGVSLNLGTKTAFVQDGNQNVIDVVDTTNVATGGMSELSTFTPSHTLNTSTVPAFVSGSNFAYVSSGSASVPAAIDLFDLTNRSSPFKVNTVNVPNISSSVSGGIAIDPRGGYIYMADYGNGTTGTALEIFSIADEALTAGVAVIDTLTLKATFQMPVQGSGVTPTCSSAANAGTIALTSAYIQCVCNGSTWVKTADGSTACTF